MDDEIKRKFDEIDDDVPEEDQIFSSRIKRFPIITPEEVEKMMKESEEKDPEVIKEVEIEVEEVKPCRGRRGRRRGRGRGRTTAKIKIKKTSEEVLLQAAEEDLDLSRTTKRRLQRLQEDEAIKRQQIEEENARVLSFDLIDDDVNIEVIDLDRTTPQKNSELSLKVHYLADVKKIKCQQSEKFSSIFCKVADAFNLKASEVLLCHKDRNIQVDDTPSSLNIKFYDLIECLPYKAEKNETDLDDNQIKVKMQSNDSKKKIDMAIHRLESMQEVMARYAKLRDIPLEKMVFEFDGEKIEGTETAEDLEMESGSCIDVKITVEKSDVKATQIKSSKVTLVELDDDSNSSEPMLQIIDIL